MPWEPQSVDVVVRCVNRERVARFGPQPSGEPGPPDYQLQTYGANGEIHEMHHYTPDLWEETFPGSRVYISIDRDPKWQCGGEFIVTKIGQIPSLT